MKHVLESEMIGASNIGPGIAAQLSKVGIHTVDELRSVTPPDAYRLLRAANHGERLPVCYYLYSLQGALDDRDWRSYSKDEKASLRDAAGL